MADSIKVLQLGAMELESGKDPSPGWGESGSEETLGANHAFPWLDFGKGKTINTVVDNSITGTGFKDIPRQVTQYVEKPLSTYARFTGLDKFHFWMFGFENEVKEVVVFVVNTPSTEPTAGAVYEDDDTPTNTLTFLRKETYGSTVYHVFAATDSAVNSASSGTLTKTGGTGDATLTYTAHSNIMYEHLYELDAHERHLMDYRTAEQITGYSAGYKKNRMSTLGIKMGTNDFRYKNAMCKKFGLTSSAGDFAMWNMEFLAYTEDRGDYSSASWTFPSTLNDSDYSITHNQMLFQVGTSESALSNIGVTDLNLDCDIPLQVMQDTNSGLYIAEPVMEGKYGISLSATMSRYSADTYQDLTDAWTSVVARMASRYGYYMTEILVQDAKISQSGPDDSDVAKENLAFEVGYTTSNNWSTWLTGNSLIQNSPIVLRVRNDESSNMMFYN